MLMAVHQGLTIVGEYTKLLVQVAEGTATCQRHLELSVNNNSSNCNLGVIKLDFETGIEAVADIDFDYLIDTTCYELTLRLSNDSENANATLILDKVIPLIRKPRLPSEFSTYQVMLVAIDTVCDTTIRLMSLLNTIQPSFPLQIGMRITQAVICFARLILPSNWPMQIITNSILATALADDCK